MPDFPFVDTVKTVRPDECGQISSDDGKLLRGGLQDNCMYAGHVAY